MTPADTSSTPTKVLRDALAARIGDDCLRLGHDNDNSDLPYSQQLQLLEAQNLELVRQIVDLEALLETRTMM